MATQATLRSGMIAGTARPSSLLGRVFTLLSLQGTRTSLDRLDDAQLRDIGITREAARKEAARPVWDVPASWTR